MKKEQGLYSPIPCTSTSLYILLLFGHMCSPSNRVLSWFEPVWPLKKTTLNLIWLSRPQPLGKNSPSESFGFGLTGATASCGKTQYTHATLLRGWPWIYHFFPAGSGTCTHHDPTSTDPPPCSRDLPWWNRGIASSRHGACSRPHPKLRECLGLSQTQRTHHCPVQACQLVVILRYTFDRVIEDIQDFFK